MHDFPEKKNSNGIISGQRIEMVMESKYDKHGVEQPSETQVFSIELVYYIVIRSIHRAFLKLCYLTDILGQNPWDNPACDQRRVFHVDGVFSGDRCHIQLALVNPVASMIQDCEMVAIK